MSYGGASGIGRRVVRDQLRRVAVPLREHWNPICSGEEPDLPADEYDRYAPGVVTLLRSGADDQRIAAHLSDVERTDMDSPPTPLERLLPAARAIRRAFEG